jgi:hypothetical protein
MESEGAADEAMLNKVHPKIQANGLHVKKHWEETREKNKFLAGNY